MAKNNRFKIIYTQGLGTFQILVDTETGVNYLSHTAGYGGGLTPLLDSQGKPIVTPIFDDEPVKF